MLVEYERFHFFIKIEREIISLLLTTMNILSDKNGSAARSKRSKVTNRTENCRTDKSGKCQLRLTVARSSPSHGIDVDSTERLNAKLIVIQCAFASSKKSYDCSFILRSFSPCSSSRVACTRNEQRER